MSTVGDRDGERVAIANGPRAGHRTTRSQGYTEVQHWTWYAHATE